MRRRPAWLIVALCSFATACSLSGDRTVVREVRSPKGYFEAVLVDVMTGGATVGPFQEIYVRPTDASWEPGGPALVFDQAEGLHLSWRTDYVLIVSYNNLRTSQLSTKLYAPPTGGDIITIVLCDRMTMPACPGRM